jgi:aminoglycoside phosphotransferase (APT) family kinase protein
VRRAGAGQATVAENRATRLLAQDGQLTGIIDWETARADHPFWDFDLGEWALGCGDATGATSAHCGRGWRAYAQTRDLDTETHPVETAFRLQDALRLLDDPGDPAVVGTIGEHLAQL